MRASSNTIRVEFEIKMWGIYRLIFLALAHCQSWARRNVFVVTILLSLSRACNLPATAWYFALGTSTCPLLDAEECPVETRAIVPYHGDVLVLYATVHDVVDLLPDDSEGRHHQSAHGDVVLPPSEAFGCRSRG